MGLIERLKKLRDIGVTEGTTPERAVYVRIVNICVAALILLNSINLYITFQAGLYIYAYAKAIVAILLFLVFPLNHKLHYTFAKIYIFALIFGFQLFCSALDDPAIIGHYNFIIYLAFAFIIFSSEETRSMILVTGLGLACFGVTLELRKYIEPRFPMTASQIISTNNGVMMKNAFRIIILGALWWYLRNLSERNIKNEQDRVKFFSDKLKSYLPHQFVDFLGKSGPDAGSASRRRRLTIFFSDIKGFTEWTDKMEPEEVNEILNDYLSEMSVIAKKWGGTIDKFIGDALMIFFGDPECTNDQDHALRCVRMAIEMQDKMVVLRKEWEQKGCQELLRIRIGINTGYATVGNFGSKDRLNYTALGSAVNFASRLESACAPDKITISNSTFSLVNDSIECESKGQIEVKGFSAPVKIYEVIGPRFSMVEKG